MSAPQPQFVCSRHGHASNFGPCPRCRAEDRNNHYPVTSTDQLAVFLGGSRFTGQLLALMTEAGPDNRARLMMAFPREYVVWESWMLMGDAHCCDITALVKAVDHALSECATGDALADAQDAAESIVPTPKMKCATCAAPLGIFYGQEGWQHFRGEGIIGRPVELYDAGHDADPVQA